MFTLKLAPLLMMLLLVQPLAAEPRIFVDTQGRQLEGTLVSSDKDSVVIKRSDGKSFTIPIKTLSGEDQKYIRDEAEKNKPTEVNGLWSKNVFTVHTLFSADTKWIVFDPQTGNYEASPKNGKEVIEHFKQQISSRKKKGIFIRSTSYAVPDTPKEREMLTDYQRTTWKTPEWLASEAKLIDDLKKECELAEIPLYVNTSADLEAPWKILVHQKE